MKNPDSSITGEKTGGASRMRLPTYQAYARRPRPADIFGKFAHGVRPDAQEKQEKHDGTALHKPEAYGKLAKEGTSQLPK